MPPCSIFKNLLLQSHPPLPRSRPRPPSQPQQQSANLWVLYSADLEGSKQTLKLCRLISYIAWRNAFFVYFVIRWLNWFISHFHADKVKYILEDENNFRRKLYLEKLHENTHKQNIRFDISDNYIINTYVKKIIIIFRYA